MKYASAMKYGGELVNAIECDYDSFKQLVPLCPECKEPVYLRAGGDRKSSKGKPYKIGAHWCHFKGVSDEQVASCESRVNGYSEKDKQRIASKARGQRLKLLQRWMGRIIDRNFHESCYGGIFEDSKDVFYLDWIEYVKSVNTSDMLDSIKVPAQSHHWGEWTTNQKISKEAFDCLKTKSMRNVASDLIESFYSMEHMKSKWEERPMQEIQPSDLCERIAVGLYSIDWIYEFEYDSLNKWLDGQWFFAAAEDSATGVYKGALGLDRLLEDIGFVDFREWRMGNSATDTIWSTGNNPLDLVGTGSIKLTEKYNLWLDVDETSELYVFSFLGKSQQKASA